MKHEVLKELFKLFSTIPITFQNNERKIMIQYLVLDTWFGNQKWKFTVATKAVFQLVIVWKCVCPSHVCFWFIFWLLISLHYIVFVFSLAYCDSFWYCNVHTSDVQLNNLSIEVRKRILKQ